MNITNTNAFKNLDKTKRVPDRFYRDLFEDMTGKNMSNPVTNAVFVDTETGLYHKTWQAICFASLAHEVRNTTFMCTVLPHNLVYSKRKVVHDYCDAVLNPLTSPWMSCLDKVHVVYDKHDKYPIPVAVNVIDNSISTQVLINMLTALRMTYEMPHKVVSFGQFLKRGVVPSIALYLGTNFNLVEGDEDKATHSTHMWHQAFDSVSNTKFDVSAYMTGMSEYAEDKCMNGKVLYTPCNAIFHNNNASTFRLEDIGKALVKSKVKKAEPEYFFHVSMRIADGNAKRDRGYAGREPYDKKYDLDKIVEAYTHHCKDKFNMDILQVA